MSAFPELAGIFEVGAGAPPGLTRGLPEQQWNADDAGDEGVDDDAVSQLPVAEHEGASGISEATVTDVASDLVGGSQRHAFKADAPPWHPEAPPWLPQGMMDLLQSERLTQHEGPATQHDQQVDQQIETEEHLWYQQAASKWLLPAAGATWQWPATATSWHSSAVPGGAELQHLRSGARAWQPLAITTKPAKQSREWYKKAAIPVVEAIASEIRASPHCLDIEARFGAGKTSRATGGCALIVAVNVEDPEAVGALQACAQQAIRNHTPKGKGVGLVGAFAQPFNPTAEGFIATLAREPCRVETSCLNLYEQGFCSNGRSCAWRHPTSTLSLSFVMGAYSL